MVPSACWCISRIGIRIRGLATTVLFSEWQKTVLPSFTAVAQVQAATLEVVQPRGRMRFAELARWSARGIVLTTTAGNPTLDDRSCRRSSCPDHRCSTAADDRAVPEPAAVLRRCRSSPHGDARLSDSSARHTMTCSTLSNWWMRYRPGGVLARGARFATEAGRDGGVLQRQLVGVDDLVGVQAHESDFAGAGEVQSPGRGRACCRHRCDTSVRVHRERSPCRPWQLLADE